MNQKGIVTRINYAFKYTKSIKIFVKYKVSIDFIYNIFITIVIIIKTIDLLNYIQHKTRKSVVLMEKLATETP